MIRKHLYVWLIALLLAGGFLHAAQKKKEPAAREKPPPTVLESAEELARAMAAPAKRVQMLAEVGIAYKKAGQKEKAEKILSEVVKNISTLEVAGNSRKKVAKSFLQNGEYKRAYLIGKELTRPADKTGILLRLAQKLADQGADKLAQKVGADGMKALQEMGQDRGAPKKSAMRSPRMSNKPMMRFQFGKVFARTGDTERAIGIFRDALDKAATSLSDDKKVPEELGRREKKILVSIVEHCSYEDLTDTVDYQYRGAMRVRAYFDVANAVKDSKGTDARRLAQRALDENSKLEQKGVQAVLYGHMTRTMADWLPELAANTAPKILESAKQATAKSLINRARTQACRAYLKLGKQDKALEIARSIDSKYYQTVALGEVALELARKDEVDRAEQVLSEAPKKFERMDYQSQLAAVYARKGMADRAMDLAGTIDHRSLRPTGLVSVANELAKNGRFRKSLAALRKVSGNPGFKTSAGNTLVKNLVESATADNYEQRLSLAVDAIETIAVNRQASSLYKIANRYRQLGELEQAAKLLDRAEQNLGQAGTAGRVYTAKAAIYWAQGNRDQAGELVNRTARVVSKVKYKYALAPELVLELDKNEKLRPLALKLARSFKSPNLRVRVLWRIAEARMKAGNREEARDLFVEGMELVKAADTPQLQVSMLLHAVEKLSDIGLEETEVMRTAATDIVQKGVAQARKAKKQAEQQEGQPGVARLVFFHSPTCSACDSVRPIINQFDEASEDVEIRHLAVTSREGSRLQSALGRKLNLRPDQRGKVPAVFATNDYLVGAGGINEVSLAKLANSAKGAPAPWEAVDVGAATSQRAAQTLGFIAVATGGFLDGFNPCAFTVLIFFVSYLGYLRKEKKEIATAGLIFTAAVFVTYFAIGLGLLQLLDIGESLTEQFNQYFQLAVAILVLVLAVLSFRDGILYLQGREKESTLGLSDSSRSRIRQLISRRARLGLTAVTTAVIGVAVALFEFPCTGQVYVPIMTLIHSEGFRAQAIGWLLLYNLFFILPLLGVFVATFYGLTSERLTEFYRNNMAKVKFGLSGLFLALFAFLVLYNIDILSVFWTQGG